VQLFISVSVKGSIKHEYDALFSVIISICEGALTFRSHSLGGVMIIMYIAL